MKTERVMRMRNRKTKIIVAKNSGFCFGVRRAVDLVLRLREQSDHEIFTIGDLIHNPAFVEKLSAAGIRSIDENALPGLLETHPKAIYVIRTHGVRRQVLDLLRQSGVSYVDATCPYVSRIHQIVSKESNDDTDTVIIGDRDHPEIIGIESWVNGASYVFKDVSDMEKSSLNPCCKWNENAIIVAQTTYNHEKYVNCQKFIKKLYTKLNIFDTICNVTEKRQNEAMQISSISDVMIVIGGTKSSNSQKLFEISRGRCNHSYFVEGANDLCAEEILSIEREKDATSEMGTFTVGITAGASTPDEIIEEVKIRMTDILENQNSDETTNANPQEISDDMSFEEMLDKSFKTLRPGERVEGVITSVTPAEIHVDLGIKHTGIIPYSEITDDPSAKIEEMFHPGDAIQVLVSKFNDAEGTVLLSKKRIDADKNWQQLVDAQESGEVLSGKIIEAVKGGLIALTGGSKVFIPASQTPLPRSENPIEEKDLQPFVGKNMAFKIIDTNPQRKRAVGSIRQAIREERQKKEDEFWKVAQVGQTFHGVVKSITPYGAFVDLGGVDGMVHITELSWKRIKHPTEIVNIGDEIDVFIKALDPEKRRISLGYKTDDQNPWTVLGDKFKVGDVAEVKIVSLMPFGAFAEIVPGVDGLIHISQIADHKIDKPSDELHVGDVVQAKITAIDFDAKRVSLSIRALIEPDLQEELVEADTTSEVLSDQAGNNQNTEADTTAETTMAE